MSLHRRPRRRASAPERPRMPRSTVSLSGCLPNLVMWIPRIQTLSAIDSSSRSAGQSTGSKPNPMASTPLLVGPHGDRGQSQLHPERTCSGSGVGVHHVRPHAACRRSRSRRPRTEPATPGGREVDDREGAQHAFAGDLGRAELGRRSRTRTRCGGRSSAPRRRRIRGRSNGGYPSRRGSGTPPGRFAARPLLVWDARQGLVSDE